MKNAVHNIMHRILISAAYFTAAFYIDKHGVIMLKYKKSISQ